MNIRRIAAVVALFLLLIPNAPNAQEDVEELTDKEKIWGLTQVWAEAKFNFPFFDQVPDLDWDASAQAYIPRVIAAQDAETYFEVLMEADPSVEARNLTDGITYIRISNFMKDQGRDQFREVFDQLDLRSTNGIILDIPRLMRWVSGRPGRETARVYPTPVHLL